MSEKVWGALFIIVALVAFCIWTLGTVSLILHGESAMYSWQTLFNLIPVPPVIYLIWIPVYLAVLLVAVIFGWVGISLVRTPSLEEIDVEELEKEIEEEAKKIEAEAKETEESKES